MAYQPFIGKMSPSQQPAKPIINPLVKQQVAQPTQPKPFMGQHNPAMAHSVTRGTSSTLDGRPVGSTAASAGVGAKPAGVSPTTTMSVEERLAKDTEAGYANADARGIGAEGSMGRLTDERKGEVDNLLAKQLAGLDGMTPEEMRAAREQGVTGINSQLSTNLGMLGDIAAGNGVRGGSAAGLQMGALNQAQMASGQLSRQLILDNLAQKNIAMDRYGNTLQTQQGVGLGIQDSNNQSKNAETLARELAAGNYTSTLDSYRSSDKADDFTQQGLDISMKAVDTFGKTGGYGGSGKDTRGGQDEETSKTNFTETYGTAANLPMVKAGPNGEKVTLSLEEAMNLPSNVFARKHGYDSAASVPADLWETPEGRKALNDQSAMGVKSESAYQRDGWTPADLNPIGAPTPSHTPEGSTTQKPLSPEEEAARRAALEASGDQGRQGINVSEPAKDKPTIICTESHRQGLISDDEFAVAERYRKVLSMREYKGYISWAKHVVPRMRKNSRFAVRIAPLVRRMIAAERFLLGETKELSPGALVVMTLVKLANYGAAYLRSLRLRSPVLANA